jgi:uncharacterized protein
MTNFKELSVEIIDFIQKYEPYSDFNYVSLFSWNTDDSAAYSFINGNLIIRIPDYTTDEIVYSMLGTSLVDDSLELLLTFTKEIKLVPRIVIENIQNPDKFTIVEDPDNFDYIYETDNISSLKGGKLKKKRNKVNKLLKEIGETLEITTIDKINKELSNDLLDVFDRWSHEKNTPINESVSERKAIIRLLDNFSNFKGLLVTILKRNGSIVGFSINEILPNKYALCHFEKSLLIHENIYTFLACETSKELENRGVSLLNWEQDLGISNLRKSKLMYGPSKYLKKYTITRA